MHLNVTDPVGSVPHILLTDCHSVDIPIPLSQQPLSGMKVANSSADGGMSSTKNYTSASSPGNSSDSSSGCGGTGVRSDPSGSIKCSIECSGATDLNGPHYLSQSDVDRLAWGAEQVLKRGAKEGMKTKEENSKKLLAHRLQRFLFPYLINRIVYHTLYTNFDNRSGGYFLCRPSPFRQVQRCLQG